MQGEIRENARETWNVVVKDDDHVLASWQRIFAVVWRQRTTLVGTENLRRECRKFAAKHADGIGLLTVVAAEAPMPASPVRQAVAEFLAEGGAYIKCSSVLMEGTGFRAAAVRSVVTGLTMLARQCYPHRVCSVPDAAAMLSQTLSASGRPTINPTALRVAIDELRDLTLPRVS
jgi:hypothetical protein